MLSRVFPSTWTWEMVRVDRKMKVTKYRDVLKGGHTLCDVCAISARYLLTLSE